MTRAVSEASKHAYCQKTLELEEAAKLVYLQLGERLYNVRNERLYEAGWDSWDDFCMEFRDLSPASISKLISVYETFVLGYGFKPEKLARAGGWTKLYQISRHVKDREDAEEWLEKAEVSSRVDLGKSLVEAKTGVPMLECPHERTYTVEICEDCGERVRVYEDGEKTS